MGLVSVSRAALLVAFAPEPLVAIGVWPARRDAMDLRAGAEAGGGVGMTRVGCHDRGLTQRRRGWGGAQGRERASSM